MSVPPFSRTHLGSTLFALALLAACGGAQAQWQWRDAQGRMQYSDLPPPRDTPPQNILQRPQAVVRLAQPQAASAPAGAASLPGSVDPALEQRRQQLERQEADRRKADEARAAELRAQQAAQNCEQARAQLRLIESGERVVRTNARGEREFLDDAGRGREAAVARQAIASECR